MKKTRNARVLKRQLLAVVVLLLTGGAVTSAAELPEVADLPSSSEVPDPLKMFDGTPVTTTAQGYGQRRGELKALFQHYMYGYMPPPPGISARVTKTDKTVLDGRATLKEVEITLKNLAGQQSPRIRLALFIPNGAKRPAPVFLALNRCGNHGVVDHPAVTIDERLWSEDKRNAPQNQRRGWRADFWCLATLIDRGYAFATFYQSDIDPDKHDFGDGVHPHYPDLPGPPESRWGTISAWAWGLHRCVDYLVTDRDVDKQCIAVIGHSRRGKTALFAGAMDERIALVVPHQSGTGGCALSRNNNQETVERINRVFPHWFNDQFVKFGGKEDKLPFDQHMLIALVAPRPLLDTAGLKDTWANYESALRALRAADPVYKFLGGSGMVGPGVVTADEKITARNAGTLLQYRRDTKHLLNKDYWEAMLDFADLQFRTNSSP